MGKKLRESPVQLFPFYLCEEARRQENPPHCSCSSNYDVFGAWWCGGGGVPWAGGGGGLQRPSGRCISHGALAPPCTAHQLHKNLCVCNVSPQKCKLLSPRRTVRSLSFCRGDNFPVAEMWPEKPLQKPESPVSLVNFKHICKNIGHVTKHH